MGRKPNALIAEFFERGQKLEDSSNRYQHTCKACGEKFPKGRIDGLTNHIVKICPAISQADRNKAHLILNERTQSTGASYLMALDLPPADTAPPSSHTVQHQTQPEVPINDGVNFSGLEALAEVSRQQLHPNVQQISAPISSRKRKRSSPHRRAEQNAGLGQNHTLQQLLPQPPMEPQQPLVMPDIILQDSQLQGLGLAPGVTNNDQSDLETVLMSINQFVAQQHREETDYAVNTPIDDSINHAMAQLIPDQLALAASAATEIMPENEDGGDILQSLSQAANTSLYDYTSITDGSGLLDPQLHPTGDHLLEQQHGHDIPSQTSLDQPSQAQHRPSNVNNNNLPHAQFLHDFRLNGDPHKSKTRGRFSPNRRKEVQEVRRQGACIRCRMLKKPCSDGMPCSTCQGVESARLWKAPCMRARIADEFDLYSAGLHNIVAFHEINKTEPKVTFDRAQYVLEASHFQELSISPAVLPSIRGVTEIVPKEATALDHGMQRVSYMNIELLNQDSDAIPSIIDQYIRRSARHFFSQESSSFMRPTLALASQLSQQKPDPLLSHVLDLWTATQMLVDPSLTWHISSITTKPSADGLTAQRIVEDIGATSPLSYQLLMLQLKAQIEKRCSHLAKSLMNDLERRLLQRGSSSSSQFETFLTAIILLNCVEKMCYLFHSWHLRSPGSATNNSSVKSVNSKSGNSSAANHWPLEKPAAQYVSKGALVSDVVSMLLRMRSIPPATVVGSDGVIHFDARASAKGGLGAQEAQDDERTAIIAAWFASLGLRVDEVVRARDGLSDGVDGGWKGWEGRFVGKLLMLGDG